MKRIVLLGAFLGVVFSLWWAARPAVAALPGFVYVQGDKFMLDGQEYFVKGMNLFYPFKYTQAKFLDLGSGMEWYEPQMFWHTFDAQKIAEEFRYYHDVLGVNTVRLFTPSLNYFDANAQYHGWDPWFLADGSINPVYRDRIVQVIDIAKQNGVRISLELFHNSHFLDWECRASNGTWSNCSLNQLKATAVSGADGRFVEPGTAKEARYLKYVQSLIPYLKDNAGVFAYEIANESLLDWPFNGQGISPRRDWFQDKIGSYLLRITREIRRLDPNHPITEGEVTEHGVSQPGWWAWPSPEFAPLNDIHNLNGGQPYTLESFLDFLAPHFYLQDPSYVGPAAAEIRRRTTKPIVLGEFGYFLNGVDAFASPETNQTRLNYIRSVVTLPRSPGVFGYFLWAPLPPLDLVPGYTLVSIPNSAWGAVRGVKLPGTPERTVISNADPAITMFSYQFTLFTYEPSYPFQLKPLPEAEAYFGAISPMVNGSTCVSSTIPSTMTLGESRSVTLEFRNSGTKPWSRKNYIILTVPWSATPPSLTPNIFAMPRDVQPGETLTHTFTLTAPQTAGTYPAQFQVLESGVGGFGATCGPQTVTVAAATPQTNGATFVSQSVPATMTPGQTASVNLVFRNSGTKAWDKIGSGGDFANAYRIKSQNPADNTTWGVSFVPIPSAPIQPGQSATFAFTITAPTVSGTYNFQWQMNQGGVGWFGDISPNRAIIVTTASTPTPTLTPTLAPTPTPTPTPTPIPTATPVGGLLFTIDGGSASARQQLQTFAFVGSGFTAGGSVRRQASFNSGAASTLSPDYQASSAGLVSWMFTPPCTSQPGTYALWLTDIATGRVSGRVTETVLANPSCASLPPSPSQYGLHEGNVVSAVASGDPDLYIVNASGYKRLFLNPIIFSFYGHLGGWSVVKNVSASVRDAFTTSGLFRNCETNDTKVYALEPTGEDTGMLHHINMTGSQALSEDPAFFSKVFCINSNEFNWYPKSPVPYTALSQVPSYRR